ncbi:MAG: alpha/beta fold hydrolase [Rhodocyclaceae bacterium]|nr:alpha/beta fold hydrolase [Rhodocyclaceae bacterium]
MRIAIGLLVGYALLCALVYWGQRSLMYFPGRADVTKLPAGLSQGYSSRALVIEPLDPVRATAILFHGNAGSALDRLFYVDAFARRGIRLILAEYPGYGWRDGPISEQALVDDGAALYSEVRAALPAAQPIFLIGESLGTGVAVQIAARQTRAPAKLILITPYASIREVASGRFRFLPVRWLLKDSFASRDFLPQVRSEITLVIAGADEVLGPQTGRDLAEVAQANAVKSPTVIELNGAGHNDWVLYVDDPFWDGILGVPGAR